ncbi:MAG TPA: hypothetical protein VIH86_16535, partial [Puia sp.]
MRSGKIYLLLFLVFISIAGFGQQGHNIKLTLKPYKNSLIYLAYYYGKLKAVADSTTLDDNSKGAFAGKEKLPGGIYLVVSPRKEILFEILLDSQQHFSIS